MSTLRVNTLQNTSTTDGGISIDTSGHVTVDGVVMPSSGPLSNRNKIINGDMRIDQRNAGAAVTVNSTANTYGVDRWFGSGQNTDGVFTIDQTTDAPDGFTNSTRITVTTADASIGATQNYLFRQAIEGNNVYDLDFGTASAKTITFSFWVRSSLTGTFGGALNNAANDRNYPFTYSISAANTWEYKTVTVTGDTTGTWLTDTGRGITLTFQIGVGSSRVATAGSWTGTSLVYGATGATNVIETLNATLDITGVQLEVGSVATPFEHRSYGDELARCQRYFQYFPAGAVGQWNSSTVCELGASYPVEMRTTPTASVNPNDADCLIFRMGISTNACTISSVTSNYLNKNGGVIGIVVSSTSSTPAFGDNAAYDPDGDSYVFFLSSEL